MTEATQSLTERIAEALEVRIKQATIPDTSVPSFGGSVGHLLAATPYDLAVTAVAEIGPEVERLTKELKDSRTAHARTAQQLGKAEAALERARVTLRPSDAGESS